MNTWVITITHSRHTLNTTIYVVTAITAAEALSAVLEKQHVEPCTFKIRRADFVIEVPH